MKFTFRRESESVNKNIYALQVVLRMRRRKKEIEGREGAERRPAEEVTLEQRLDHKKA